LFRTEIRVSVWFFVLAIFICLNLGWQAGVVVGLILFFSLLLHELAHVFAARKLGGNQHEVLIWPLGGLIPPTPAPLFSSEILTILAGPLMNGLICLACLPHLVSSGAVRECVALLTLPEVDLASYMLHGVILLIFSINFKLLIVNLFLPVFPLDAGQLSFSGAKLYWDRQTAKIGSLWGGMVASLLLILAGVLLKSLDLVMMASILMMMSQHEFWVAQVSAGLEQGDLGYDFSQGYTSLEADEDREAARAPGLMERWRLEREEQKRLKERQLKIETDRRLDELLDKVHQHGMNSLTPDERRFLEQASSRYRSPGKE